MQRPILALALAVPLLMLPTLVTAQVAGQPINRIPNITGRMTSDQQMSRFENEEYRRRLNPSVVEAEAQHGAERLELARQVAVRVEQYKCDEARAMAKAAGDRQMGLRIRGTCR